MTSPSTTFCFCIYYIKQIDFVLPWVWCGENIWHTRLSLMCYFRLPTGHMLTSSVIYHWTEARQHEIHSMNILIIGEIVEYLITWLWIIGTIDLLKPEIYLLITSRTEFSKPPSLIVWNIKKAYLSIELPGTLSKSVLDWITEHLQKPAEPF